MTSFGTVLSAGYMSDGMRAWKQNANGKTYFLYDGSQPVMELSSSGSTLATNTFGPSGPLARTSNSRTLLYTTDVQGNVSQQINAATGAVVASYGFDAWGHRSVVTSDPTASSDPYSGFGGMVGYYTDWETGLELCGLRYYDSGTGRWLNRDPISYAGGINLYEYCGDQSVGMGDSSGQLNWGDIWSNMNNGSGWGGAAISCINNLLQYKATCPNTTFADMVCRVLMDCFLALGCFSASLAGPQIGCIVSAILTAGQGFIDSLCDSMYQSCPAYFPSLCHAIVQAALGCLGGCIPGVGGFVIGIAGMLGIGNIFDNWCKSIADWNGFHGMTIRYPV